MIYGTMFLIGVVFDFVFVLVDVWCCFFLGRRGVCLTLFVRYYPRFKAMLSISHCNVIVIPFVCCCYLAVVVCTR